MYPFVVVDCPPGLTDVTLACISQSDQIVIVITAELPAVRNAVRYIQHLERLGVSPKKIKVALNRHSRRGPLADEQIEKALGRNISIRIPNAYHEVVKAINAGEPISSDRSDFAQAINRWAKEVPGNPSRPDGAQPNGTGFLFFRK